MSTIVVNRVETNCFLSNFFVYPTDEVLHMHILILPVSATCSYSSTVIYPDEERVIWMRSQDSELAYL